MTFSKDNLDDIRFIEIWYADIEKGYRSLGKEYKRPINYIERALQTMNESKQRNRMYSQNEGLTRIDKREK